MEQDSLSYKTLRNSAYLLMGVVLPMFFTVYLAREMGRTLGSLEFGVYFLVNAISSFVGYVDLGLGTAVTKYVAEYQGSGDVEGLRNILSSARVLFFFTGLLGLLVFTSIGYWFLPFFHIQTQNVPHIFVVFFLMGLVFFFSSLTTVYSAVLNALQRFDLITKLGMANLILTSLGTIFLLRAGFRLKAIIGLNALTTFLLLVIVTYYTNKLMPELRLRFIFVRSEIKKAYSFGLWAFISNLASSCLTYLDRLIIPIFLGPAALPFYSVPGNAAIKTSVVTNGLAGMLFPMASTFFGSGEISKLKNIYIRAFRNLSMVAAAITVAIIIFANKILLFWMADSQYAQKGTGVLIILAITYYFIALYIPLQGMLLGLGKLKFLIRQSLFMVAINIILLIILVPRFGILGAAWAYLVAVLPMIFAFYWVEKNLFNITSGQIKYYSKLYVKLFFAAFVSGMIMQFLLLPLAANVWQLAIVGPFSVLLYVAVYFVLGFVETEDVEIAKSFFRTALKNKFSR